MNHIFQGKLEKYANVEDSSVYLLGFQNLSLYHGCSYIGFCQIEADFMLKNHLYLILSKLNCNYLNKVCFQEEK